MENDSKEFKALVKAMKETPTPLLLVGAGVSVDSGYPSWKKLIEQLKEKATISPKYHKYLENLNDPPWQAEEYERFIGKKGFASFIEETFKPKDKIGSLHQAISKLPFRHILTTNYDPCIEQAFGNKLNVVRWEDSKRLSRFFIDISRQTQKPYLVYLHGTYKNSKNIILTESCYAKRYVRTDNTSMKLYAILLTQPFVFIGFSVNDPDLNNILREVNARLGGVKARHFAFIGYEMIDEKELIIKRFKHKYGITPILYKVVDNNHSELLKLLKELHLQINGTELEVSEEQKIEIENYDEYDPHKGRFGRKSMVNNRVLLVENAKEHNNYYSFDIVLRSVNNQEYPLQGQVKFYLHPTFPKNICTEQVYEGEARHQISYCWGAFTVGAVIEKENTKLELDLATLKGTFKDWFLES